MAPRRWIPLAVLAGVVVACADGDDPADPAGEAVTPTSAQTGASTPVINAAEDDPTHGCSGAYPSWESSPYVLPYPVGDAWPLGLDNCSSSFHGSNSPDSHAYDFDMDVGSEVVASRGGTVQFVYGDDPDGGGTPAGNLVVLDHGDGTVAVYLHFTADGIDVDIGDAVTQGQVIGRSGASGTNAGYPHLHLIVVEAPGEYPYVGVPITFSNTTPNPRGLVSGETYLAMAP